jgi:hypothetical protein
MKNKKKLIVFIGSLFLLIGAIIACATQPIASVTQKPEAQFAQKTEAQVTPKPEAKPVSPYAVEVTPLTPADCGRCHSTVFNLIKKEGGKHQIECVQCHTKYHVYSPVKQNWKEIMPKCQDCHGLIHGEKYATCSTCHTNPHAPKTQMTMSAEMAKVCSDCHAKVAQELLQNLSKHTKVDCSMCHHEKHGYIPSCTECHKPHIEGLTVKECLACHPVHSPLKISYADTVKNDVCGACHAQVYQKIKTTVSRHGPVACAKCHSKHKYIPKCEECHGKPHGEVVLKKFPNCLQCHVDVHDLPSKSAGR